jgi:hypothetical protein
MVFANSKGVQAGLIDVLRASDMLPQPIRAHGRISA